MIISKKMIFIGSVYLSLIPYSVRAATFDIPLFSNTIGQNYTIEAKAGDTLSKIAERYGIGNAAILKANPKIGKKSIQAGTVIHIPGKFNLPSSAEHTGIVLNLADLRVFYFSPNGETVSTYPVGIGREGWATPQGETEVVSKKKDPVWRPPESIKREAARKGKTLPDVVPAGPKNPLGKYAIRLGIGSILIHGTNAPSSVGLRSSHGCIRMFAADIKDLFEKVEAGTPVKIIYEPHHEGGK